MRSDHESVDGIDMKNKVNKKIIPTKLHCNDVWFESDLPWRPEEGTNNESNCLFSVVQSTSGASPSVILKLLSDFLEKTTGQ